MKRILLIAFCILPMASFSQEFKAIEMPGATKSELYKRAIWWIAQEFKSANDVIQLKDEEAGEIVAKGAIPYTAPLAMGDYYSGHFTFTLTFECKDGKYRYLIDRLSHTGSHRGYSIGDLANPSRNKKKLIEHGYEAADNLGKRFEEGMKEKKAKDNW